MNGSVRAGPLLWVKVFESVTETSASSFPWEHPEGLSKPLSSDS
jgi:hypothetical protein